MCPDGDQGDYSCLMVREKVMSELGKQLPLTQKSSAIPRFYGNNSKRTKTIYQLSKGGNFS
jgi:hypothetical protein